MTRKITDISPPKREKIYLPKKEKRKPSIKIHPIFLSLFLLFLVGFGIFQLSFSLSKAKIQIWRNPKEKTFEEQVIVDTNLKEINFQENKIPGEIFEIEEEFSGFFPASGKILKKAEGKIRLYNQYTTREERWVAGTRFISSEGKIFLAKDSFVVPGAKLKEGKLEPSFVDVEVVAAEGGKDYNIGPSKFSVIAFRGTERFFKYWGESFEPMKGGGEFPVVKKEDLEHALNSLKEEIEKIKGKEALKKKLPDNKIFPEGAVLVEILDQQFSAKEGEEAENFSLKVKAKIKTITLSKEILQKFFQEKFYPKIGPGSEIVKNSEKISLFASVADFENGKFLVSIKVSFQILPHIDPLLLKREIAGKEVSEVKTEFKTKLQTLKQVESIQIKVFPFWVQKIPENLDRIQIEILSLD